MGFRTPGRTGCGHQGYPVWPYHRCGRKPLWSFHRFRYGERRRDSSRVVKRTGAGRIQHHPPSGRYGFRSTAGTYRRIGCGSSIRRLETGDTADRRVECWKSTADRTVRDRFRRILQCNLCRKRWYGKGRCSSSWQSEYPSRRWQRRYRNGLWLQ